MKRLLVLSNEAARHPFRQRLPRHVFTVKAEEGGAAKMPRPDDQDWKLFVLSFSAFFTVAYSFIA
jgi:hypothetical protein